MRGHEPVAAVCGGFGCSHIPFLTAVKNAEVALSEHLPESDCFNWAGNMTLSYFGANQRYDEP